MASITPDARKIKRLRTWQALETWLRANQEREMARGETIVPEPRRKR